MSVLALRRVRSVRRQKHALDQVSFKVEKGQLSLLLSDSPATRREIALIFAGLCRPTDGTALLSMRNAWTVEKVSQRATGYVIPGLTYEEDLSLQETVDLERSLRHLPAREKPLAWASLDLNPEQLVKDLDADAFARFQLLLAHDHRPTTYILTDLYTRTDAVHHSAISEFIAARIGEGNTILILDTQWSPSLTQVDLLQVIKDGKLLLDAETHGATEHLPVVPGINLLADDLDPEFYARCLAYQHETSRESMQYLPGEGPRPEREEPQDLPDPLQERLKGTRGKIKR